MQGDPRFAIIPPASVPGRCIPVSCPLLFFIVQVFSFFHGVYLCALMRDLYHVMSRLLLSIVSDHYLGSSHRIATQASQGEVTCCLVSGMLYVLLVRSGAVMFLISIPLLGLSRRVSELNVLGTLGARRYFCVSSASAAGFSGIAYSVQHESRRYCIASLASLGGVVASGAVASLSRLRNYLALASATLAYSRSSLTMGVGRRAVGEGA